MKTEFEKPYKQSAIRDQICRSIFQGYCLEETRSDLDLETQTGIIKSLSALGVDYASLRMQRGVTIYDNRLEASLVGLVFLALNATKIVRFPEHIEFEQEVLNYYIENPNVVASLRKKWGEIRDTTGVITPLSIVNGESIDSQIRNYLDNGVVIDRYSEENRYTRLFAVIRTLTPKFGSVVEFGTGAADNLLNLEDSAQKLVGNDLESIERIIDNPMLHQYRWHNDRKKMLAHLKKLEESNVNFVAGNMFDRDVIDRVFSDLLKPTLVMFLNVLNHYHSTKVAEIIDQVLPHNPEFIVIGGGYPGLEEEFDGAAVHGRHSRIFKVDQNQVQILAHIVDQNLPK